MDVTESEERQPHSQTWGIVVVVFFYLLFYNCDVVQISHDFLRYPSGSSSSYSSRDCLAFILTFLQGFIQFFFSGALKVFLAVLTKLLQMIFLGIYQKKNQEIRLCT